MVFRPSLMYRYMIPVLLWCLLAGVPAGANGDCDCDTCLHDELNLVGKRNEEAQKEIDSLRQQVKQARVDLFLYEEEKKLLQRQLGEIRNRISEASVQARGLVKGMTYEEVTGVAGLPRATKVCPIIGGLAYNYGSVWVLMVDGLALGWSESARLVCDRTAVRDFISIEPPTEK